MGGMFLASPRNCLASTLDDIVVQVTVGNREKDYSFLVFYSIHKDYLVLSKKKRSL